MERLSAKILQTYNAPQDIDLPLYDRANIKAGIVHFGPGNFPLAHIAYKTHQLMQSGDVEALKYGIVAVSIHSASRRDQLTPQNGLYTVAEQDLAGQNKMTVVGSVISALFAPENPGAVIAQLASLDTRIISLTITPQAHQSYMDANGNLNLLHPDIAHDMDPSSAPITVFGYIARGIQQREAQGLPGLTIMNLDNMQHNGDVFGNLVRQFVEAYDPSTSCNKYTFPNSMVDRIVPGTTPELLQQVKTKAGFIDAAAVPAEPMPEIGSWVLEDTFASGRPAWQKLGLAQIVGDVLPYEKMKLRILNVSHSWMANLGDLAGYTYIDETMNDPLFRQGTAALMNNETGPTLLEVPGIDIQAYEAEIIERFANPAVQDTTWRVSKDAPLQVVLDSAREQLASGGSFELLALNVAAWMRRFRVETNELGGKIDAVHPMAGPLKTKAKEGGNDPSAMFTITEVFGDIGQHADFVSVVGDYMSKLESAGVKATIQKALDVSQYTLSLNQHTNTHPLLAGKRGLNL